MFITLRTFIFIFLVILQLLAPLVHAHTDQKNPAQGLHVPGLEIQGVEHETLMFQASRYDFSSDGIMIGVDAGMKDKRLDAAVELDHSHYLYQQFPSFNPTRSLPDTGFLLKTAQVVCRLRLPSLSPRAPPAQ